MQACKQHSSASGDPPVRLWQGQTIHTRHYPFAGRFAYQIMLLDLDIDRLAEAHRQAHLFSVDGFNLFAFHQSDHGGKPFVPLSVWARERFAEIGLEVARLRLLTFPRIWGYGFAPISLWQGYGKEGALNGILYEVHNTFGDRHTYMARVESADRVQQSADKHMHVSPFFDVSGAYHFVLRAGGERFRLIIRNMDAGRCLHTASLLLRPCAFKDSTLLQMAVKMPFSAHGVSWGIHWEAFKLWLKGAKYRPPPPAPSPTSRAKTQL